MIDEVLEREDAQSSWERIRVAVQELAGERGEWAGLPLPIHGPRLVVESRHPLAGKLNGASLDAPPEPPEDAPSPALGDVGGEEGSHKLRNEFLCLRAGCNVLVAERPGGKVYALKEYLLSRAGAERLHMAIQTLGVAASPAWSLKAEARALDKLQGLVTPHQMKCYLLSGGFLETSPRSLVTYLFRKLHPTVVLAPYPRPDGEMKILACLCLHPVGYYQGTWAGVMVPTDCIIAHLMLMRADEHFYWRKCNQHPPWAPEAGL